MKYPCIQFHLKMIIRTPRVCHCFFSAVICTFRINLLKLSMNHDLFMKILECRFPKVPLSPNLNFFNILKAYLTEALTEKTTRNGLKMHNDV